MKKKNELSKTLGIDTNEINNSFEQQMDDLGISIERPNREITGAKWTDGPNTQKRTNMISVTKIAVYFPERMGVLDKVTLGTGRYKNNVVLLIKADPKGFKLNKMTGQGARRCGVQVKRVVNDLLAAGLKPGLYKPVKAKECWVGLPLKGGIDA